MRLSQSLILSASLAIALPVTAEGPEDSYFDLMPYFTRVDSDRNTEHEALGLRGAFGWGWNGPWYSEVQMFGTILETENRNLDTDFYMSGLGFDVAYNFGDRQAYTPYLLAGLGAVYDDVLPDSDDTTSAFINLAAGITTQEVTPRGVRLRAEVRYMYDFFKDGMSDWQLGLGISIPLRCPPPPVVAMAPPPAPVPVLAPSPAPMARVQVKLVDSDGDGVLDRDDRCPDTLGGAKVDSDGCVIANQIVTLADIHFQLNSANLTPAAQQSLMDVARSLRSQSDATIEIAGHTDSQGNDNYNLQLSQKRADSVRSYLISNGVEASRLSANGYGEQQPVSPNDTASGRAQNRRVEMRFR